MMVNASTMINNGDVTAKILVKTRVGLGYPNLSGTASGNFHVSNMGQKPTPEVHPKNSWLMDVDGW